MNFRKIVIVGIIGIGIISLGIFSKPIAATTDINQPELIEGKNGTNQPEQVKANIMTRNEWRLSVEKIVIDPKSDSLKGAAVYFSFINNNGLDKEFTTLNGKIIALVGISGKLYEMSWNNPIDENYNGSKSLREQYAKNNGTKFESGKFNYTVHLMVDGAEEGFTKVIYQNGNGNKVEIPIQGVMVEIAQPHNAK